MPGWREVLEVPDWLRARGDELEPIPGWFREIAEPVLSDMQGPAPIDLCLDYVPSWTVDPRNYERMRLDGEGTLYVWEPEFSGASGYGVGAGHGNRAIHLVEFADWLQEQVYPETKAAWGEPRPACPGHGHPASPREINGEAW